MSSNEDLTSRNVPDGAVAIILEPMEENGEVTNFQASFLLPKGTDHDAPAAEHVQLACVLFNQLHELMKAMSGEPEGE